MSVAIVTDSTSDLPPDLAASLGVTVVPVYVHFGTDAFKDGVELSADDFYSRLVSAEVMPTTSAPAVGEFVDVYDKIGKEADGIVSIHISSKLSRTVESADQAKEQATATIEVVDSRQASMGLGMTVMAAANAARDGAEMAEVTKVAKDASSRSQCLALFDTLEFLEKGGRIGKARAFLGSLLKIKPLISVIEGEVHEAGKARTFPKGIAKLQELAREHAPLESLAIMHATSPDLAAAMAGELKDTLDIGNEPFVARFGPALGTHVGPGAMGVGLLRKG